MKPWITRRHLFGQHETLFHELDEQAAGDYLGHDSHVLLTHSYRECHVYRLRATYFKRRHRALCKYDRRTSVLRAPCVLPACSLRAPCV